MKLVFLDAKTIGDDIDLNRFLDFGEVVRYDFSTSEEAYERTRDADVVIVNKVEIGPHTIGGADHLKLVCVTATGTNNLDKDYLAERGITWRNVAGYSTETVAQHTFAMLFYLLEKLSYYDAYVKKESYVNDRMFTHFEHVFTELNQKTWGIIGLGAIGRRVAEIAKAFGCRVIYYSTSGCNANPDYERVSFDELLAESDVVSVHAPLDANTKGLMDAEAFSKMKKSAIFLNLGRGPIVAEEDLATALEAGEIAAAGLDVLTVEPMAESNPLRRIKDSEKLLITPHIAWASVEARNRLMQVVYGQVAEFLNQPEAVIFDLDGTLLYTLEDLKDAVNASLGAFGLPERTLAEVERFVGNGVRNLMLRAVEGGEDHPQFEEIFAYFKEYYKKHCNDKTCLYAGVEPLLKTLRDRGIRMGIVSNKYDVGVKVLQKKYFEGLIPVAIGETEEISKKPDPASLQEAMRLLGAKADKTLYVGDSEVDLETAKRAGVTCVSATWGYRSKEELSSCGARIFIQRPEELLDVIDGRRKEENHG